MHERQFLFIFLSRYWIIAKRPPSEWFDDAIIWVHHFERKCGYPSPTNKFARVLQSLKHFQGQGNICYGANTYQWQDDYHNFFDNNCSMTIAMTCILPYAVVTTPISSFYPCKTDITYKIVPIMKYHDDAPFCDYNVYWIMYNPLSFSFKYFFCVAHIKRKS